MKLDIPNKKMRQKLEGLLAGVPGNFRYHPERVSGLDQLVVFRERGITCPEFSVRLEDARKWAEAGHQVFGRNKNHEQGRDIVDQSSADWPRKEFWTKVVRKRREYRIHIFDDQHIQRALKRLDPKAPPKSSDALPIWNTQTGYIYDHDFEPPGDGVELARRAVGALKYLWGAVDLLDDETGRCFVLEVNTAPGMDETTAQAYADAIRKYVERTKTALDAQNGSVIP
jgi:hypothetical protein